MLDHIHLHRHRHLEPQHRSGYVGTRDCQLRCQQDLLSPNIVILRGRITNNYAPKNWERNCL